MKRVVVILLVFIGLFCLSSCSSNKQIDYPEYSVVENTELGCVELHYENTIYRPYGGFSTNDFRGKQIGIREGVSDSKICEVKGYESDKWIIEYLDVIMGGGDMLFKATSVTEIPNELERYKRYDY